MLVRINNCFLWGILFASATWSLSLYLYWLWSINGYTIDKTQDNSIRYKNIEIDKREHKQNDNAPALEQDGSYDNKGDSKYSGNVWRSNAEYLKRMELKEQFSKQLGIKSTSHLDDSLDDQFGLIRNVDDVKNRNKGYILHAFNALISERIGNHRDIPDTRHKLCTNEKFSLKLPKASVIICFYNEHFETLMRSVHSILDRTDHAYLKEIILVDDLSDLEGLHDSVQRSVNAMNGRMRKVEEMLETNNIEVEDYINDEDDKKLIDNDDEHFSKTGVNIKLLRTSKREGLIRARLYGADNSVGEILVFLDSHIEVNVNWLPPLLARLVTGVNGRTVKYSTRAVTPIIDVINADTFEYTSSPLVRGGFNWGLHFKWDNLPNGTLRENNDFVRPIQSPTMAGGLFAIYREYFNYIGKYDPGMDIWGGENLEISFRIWMCGGTLELIPCSRVGHVFRKRRPYALGDKEDYMLRNSMRMARVWMDEYVNKVIEQTPAAATVEVGDISDRIALRQRLQCKTFKWYLNTVYPELETSSASAKKQKLSSLNDPQKNKFQPWHSRKRNYTDSYQIRLKNTSLCIQSAKDIKTKGSGLLLASCIRTLNQIWFETDRHELVLGRTLCMDASNNMAPSLGKCHELGGNQEWMHKGSAGSPVYNSAAGMCLGVDQAYRGEPILMVICDNQLLNQWDFVRS